MDSVFWCSTPAEEPQKVPASDDVDDIKLFNQYEPLGADPTSVLQQVDWENVRMVFFVCLSMALLINVLILFLEGAFTMSSRFVDGFAKDFCASGCGC